jgi:hypothetical protein
MNELTARLFKNLSVLLADEPVVDRQKLIDVVDEYLAMPRWRDADRLQLIAQLESSRAIWIGDDRTLSNPKGHKPWLVDGRIDSWRYWQRYATYLNGKLPPKVLDNLDRSTRTILGEHLEDPRRDGPWYRRGLICGDVQSGKTTHYTGLINRAADAGYKIIVVLAGMHNNLRSQTQARLDEGFLGYLSADEGGTVNGSAIGVGTIDRDPEIRPNTVTNRDENGDFSTGKAKGLNVSPEERPYLFVIKKNKTPLTLLIRWVWQSVAQEAMDLGVRKGDLPKHRESDPDPEEPEIRRLVRKLPLLVIDDEADQASIDTKKLRFDASGNPNDEHDPARINGLIRQLIQLFDRKAYVGYTATPFANIFIHDQSVTDGHGPDLFPESFIINTPTPSDYIGPNVLFPEDEGTPATCAKLVCPILDADDELENEKCTTPWMPLGHKKDHFPSHDGRAELPPSLKDAVAAFILSGCGRAARGQGQQHHSMLIHVTRFIDVQKEVRRQVDEYFAHLRRMVLYDRQSADTELRAVWERRFVAGGLNVEVLPETMRRDLSPLSWDGVAGHLPAVMERIDVRTVNGGAGDVLDYRTYEGKGLWVIAIGGDKLSRGLTLEGLTVSYFLRASTMYDTLMQMGRWFGYRKGYLDLCRIYLPPELRNWYGHIARASAELRRQFDQMADQRRTPYDFGLKVRTHPSLMVTSAVKMRHGHTLRVGFSGYHAETIAFHATEDPALGNWRALEQMIRELNTAGLEPDKQLIWRRPSGPENCWKDSLVWKQVPWEIVCGFLDNYRIPEEAKKFRPELMSGYIRRVAAGGGVKTWTIAVLKGDGKGEIDLPGFPNLRPVKRTADKPEPNDPPQDGALLTIGRVVNPRDEEIDIGNSEWSTALEESIKAWRQIPADRRDDAQAPRTPYPSQIRAVRAQDRGLLLVYPFTPDDWAKSVKPGLANIKALVGTAIFFPQIEEKLDRNCAMEYKVNNKYWSLEVASDG